MSDKNEALLKEIRDRWDYHCLAWRKVWEEGNKDMKYVSGDPWDDLEREARRKVARPCLTFDELQQHVDQTENEMAMNPLAIQVKPEGYGADQKHAEIRQARIRKIEYESRARPAYLRAYRDMIERSYGYFGLNVEYCGDCGFDQKIGIVMFPNPNAVSLDPDAKMPASADMLDAFVIDNMPKSKFKRLYPNADIKDFSGTHMIMAPKWITDSTVQVAEYWKVDFEKRISLESEGLKIFEDELPDRGMKRHKQSILMPDGTPLPILAERKTEKRTVKMYLTNGVEILDETDWLGSWIPIFPMYGKEEYVEEGGVTNRILRSRVRGARDPFMAYCYARSCQAELIRMTPKLPYLGYEGQFATTTNWAQINDVPQSYGEVKATVEGAPAGVVLPLPQRQSYEPAIAALEMFCEACKRAIQSAFGSYNASVGKEDTHARSGVAIKSLQAQTSRGTYHFVDSYITALEQAGRCINEVLDKIENTPRDVGLMYPDDRTEMIRLHEQNDQGEIQTYGEGNYGIVVSVGPSFQTQREEASAFLDTMVQNLQAMPFAPEVKSKLISLAIKAKSLGPMGDEMAKLLDPAGGDIPPQVQAQMQQAQQVIQQMQQQIQMLVQEKQAKTMELQTKEKIAEIQADVDRVKIQADVEIALAKIGSTEGIEELNREFELLKARIDQLSTVGDRQHEAGMQAMDLAAQAELTAQDRAMQPAAP